MGDGLIWTFEDLRDELGVPSIVRPDIPLPPTIPAQNTTKGIYRRLRIHVPTPDGGGTSMALGWKASGLNFPGFGLDTVGHVVVNARGDTSTITQQSKGQFLAQSENDSLILVSGASSILASSKVANVLGSGGVVLCGGWSDDIVNHPVDGLTPAQPTAVKDFETQMSAISIAWGAFDSLVAAACVVRSLVENIIDPSCQTPIASTMLCGGTLAALGCIVNNVVGAAGASAAGGVTIHGTGGYLLGTPLYGSLYAGLGLTAASLYPFICGFKDAEMLGGHNAKLTSFFHAAVQGNKTAKLLSVSGETEVASRSGDLKLLAPKIELGSIVAEPPQLPTASVVSRATSHISLATNPAAGSTDPGVHIDSASVATVTAVAQIKLTCGAFEVVVAPNAVTITMGQDGGSKVVEITPTTTTLTQLQSKVTIGIDKINVTCGATDMEVSPAGATINGAMIKLG